MKALTLWQPWASAIALGIKQYETRSWSTNHRGPLAIHAACKSLTPEEKALAEKYDIPTHQKGEIVAIVELEECILMTPEFIAAQSETERAVGIWSPGRYAWKFKTVRIPSTSKSVRGHQGLWNWDEES